MSNVPDARAFATGWAVQNVCTPDLSQTESLVRRCREDAERRGIEPAPVEELTELIRAEIAAYEANSRLRRMSRDD